jgi:hypothetical protein
MNIRNIIICLAGMILLIFSIAVAQENFPVVIKFDGAIDGGGTKDIHPSTYTGPVTFPHGKHVNEYGASCPDCHHHNDAMSLMGSGSTDGLRCANCQVKEGLVIKNETPKNTSSALRRPAVSVIRSGRRTGPLNKR